MAFYPSAPYRNATTIANHLMTMIVGCKEGSMAQAHLAKAWLEIEQTKREWRGIPRLSTASARELLAAKRDALKSAAPVEAFTELDAPTVTAPPSP